MNQLALLICKSEQSSGLTPALTVGPVPSYTAGERPTLVNEHESWTLLHEQEYTAYSYIVKNGGGFVSISLFVPADKKLNFDNPPYEVLMSVFRQYDAMGYPATVTNKEPFILLLGRCRLEERIQSMLLPVMAGANPASFCADSRTQVSALLRFSQYRSLAFVSRLEIGMQCATTVSIPIKAKPASKPQADPQPKPQEKPAGKPIGKSVEKSQEKPAGKPQEKTAEKSQSDTSSTSNQEKRPPVPPRPKSVPPGSKPVSKKKKRGCLKWGFLSLLALFLLFGVLVFLMNDDEPAPQPDVEDTEYLWEDSVVVDSVAVEVADTIMIIEDDSVARAKAQQLEEEEVRRVIDNMKKKEQAREEILELVNKKNLAGCRAHKGWNKYLTQEERSAVEAILNMEVQNGGKRKRLYSLLKDKFPFKNWDELLNTRYEIIKIVSE